MKKNLPKIIIFVLMGIVILSGFSLKIQASDEQKDETKAEIISFRTEDFSGEELKQKSPKDINTDPVGTGITWLKDNQNPQGSWSNNEKTELIDTSAVFSFLSYIEEDSSIEYQEAIDWLNLTFPENSDYLAEKVIFLSGVGQDVNSLMEFLASQINEKDGGFGYQKDYQGDIITTAKVLKAINVSSYSDSGSNPNYTLASALIYLLQSQNSDGSWSKIKGGETNIKTTALVLGALQPYQSCTLETSQGDIVVQDRIDLTIGYLKNHQDPDGSWKDIEGTAKVYDTLLNYQEYPNHNQEALYYLLSNQESDGSFAEQNVYLTAKALNAIAKPDIAVEDIKDISDESTIVEITIVNLGYRKLELFCSGEEICFRLIIDDQTLDIFYSGTINFEPSTEISMEIGIEGLAFGTHFIEFLVNYNGVELDKTNNQKSLELLISVPGDVNGDCKVNVLDLVFVRNYLSQDPNSSIEANRSDVNQDGKINVLDMVFIRNHLGTNCQ